MDGNKMFMKKLILSAGLLGIVFSAKPMGKDFITLDNAKWLGVTVGIGYAAFKSAFVVHEFGHAATAKSLTGVPIDVHVGATYEESLNTSPIIKLGGFTFYKNALHPMSGQFSKTRRAGSSQTLISAAGPLAGAAVGASLMKYSDNTTLKCLGAVIVGVQLQNLIPTIKSGSDGENIAHTFFDDHRYCIGQNATYIGWAGLVGAGLLAVAKGWV